MRFRVPGPTTLKEPNYSLSGLILNTMWERNRVGSVWARFYSWSNHVQWLWKRLLYLQCGTFISHVVASKVTHFIILLPFYRRGNGVLQIPNELPKQRSNLSNKSSESNPGCVQSATHYLLTLGDLSCCNSMSYLGYRSWFAHFSSPCLIDPWKRRIPSIFLALGLGGSWELDG